MKKNDNFQSFTKYILRTPSYPINFYTSLIENYSSEKLIKIFNEPYFNEAIYIASPIFYETIQKYINDKENTSHDKLRKIELSLLKYIARSSTRCTPFGLFSGCSVGSFDNKNEIRISKKENFKRVNQIDMQIWGHILGHLETNRKVREHLHYYLNKSTYQVADFYRYIEYSYQDNMRVYNISALRVTETLKLISEHSRKGILFKDLIQLLITDLTELEEAKEFIHILIDSQFLVSSLEPTVTGYSEWEEKVNELESIPYIENEVESLKKIFDNINKLDFNHFNNKVRYKNLRKGISKLLIEFEEKKIIQTDLYINCEQNILNKSIDNKIKETLEFLNCLPNRTKQSNINSFINAFKNRYEERTVPLTTALDPENGIGYPIYNSFNDTHDLLEKFNFPNKTQNNTKEDWAKFDLRLEEKLKEAEINNHDYIIMSESDLDSDLFEKKNIPPTFSVMVEVYLNKEIEQLYVDALSSSSAAKLIGRFCNQGKEINELFEEIINKEKIHSQDVISAEIIHLPESKIGNVLRRANFREFEIPYLGKSSLPIENQIYVEDLTISIKNNKIQLWSKTLKKQIIPYLSNAHNYSANSLPIYHFLADLQGSLFDPIQGFHWGVLENHYHFFPRVIYKNVIISKAKWIIRQKELENLLRLKKSQDFESFNQWKIERKLPKYFNIVEFDNKLLIDSEEKICIELFYDVLKTKNSIVLEEYLFSEKEQLVKNEKGDSFTNQFIFSYYSQKQNV